MNSLLQADIFFFIASIATVILAIFAGIALWHISRVAKNIHQASDTIRDGVINIVSHVAETKDHFAHVVEEIKNNFTGSKKKKQSHKTPK